MQIGNSAVTPQISFTNTTGAARTAPAATTPVTPESIAAFIDSLDLSGLSQSSPSAPAASPAKPGKPTQPQIDGPVQELPAPLPTKKWTVMLWSASDNNLYRFMQDDIDEAERVGSTNLMNVIVQTDHAKAGGGAKRYELQADDKPMLHSPVRADLGNTNMADPKQLSDFIQWSMKNYPAENYMLVMSDHGGGWKGACEDDSKNGWMTPEMIQGGLRDAREKTGKKIDVLGFDACLMANAEVAHQLKDEATYLVGSEEVEGGAGWQYDDALTHKQTNRVFSADMLSNADTAMRSRVDFTPKEFATNIVTMAQGHQGDLGTMTAFDTSKVQAITDSVKNFGQAILDTQVPVKDLKQAKRDTQDFYEFKDLGDFAAQVSSKAGTDEKLKAAAAAVQTAIGDAIIAEQHSTKFPNAHGITIELDQQRSDRTNGNSALPNMDANKASRLDMGSYGDLQFAKDTNWQAVQAKLNQPVAGEVEHSSHGSSQAGGISEADLEAILSSMTPEQLNELMQALAAGQAGGQQSGASQQFAFADRK